MGLYVPLPLSLLSHCTYFVILLSNPVNWPSWAAWLIAPINTSHNVFGGWGWSHTHHWDVLQVFFRQSHRALLYTVQRGVRITSQPLNPDQNADIFKVSAGALIQPEIVKTLRSHSNSSGIMHCTWLSVDSCTERKWFVFFIRCAIFCHLLLKSTVASVWFHLNIELVRIQNICNPLSLYLEDNTFKQIWSFSVFCFFMIIIVSIQMLYRCCHDVYPWFCHSCSTDAQLFILWMLVTSFKNVGVCLQSLLYFWLHS